MAGGFSSDSLLQRCTQSAGAGPFPFLRDELGGQRGQHAVEYTTITVFEQQDTDELSNAGCRVTPLDSALFHCRTARFVVRGSDSQRMSRRMFLKMSKIDIM